MDDFIDLEDTELSDSELSRLEAHLSNLSLSELTKMQECLEEVENLQRMYPEFPAFYYDVSVELLGFTPSAMQMDIAHSLAHSPKYYMIQAQRREAKTTIAGAYAVWCIIHNPRFRVLIVTADSKFAQDVMLWCTQILDMMPVLHVLSDKATGKERRNTLQYDVNLLLKGADKSPSIASVGIFGTLPGKRSDLTLVDDIETNKNSYTEVMRERLKDCTFEFKRINPEGKTLYLGTPQNTNSIYGSLPARGCTIDIWPGRIPTEKEIVNYEGHLSAYVQHLYDTYPDLRTGFGMEGDRGAPTDHVMMSEEMLLEAERDGKAGFLLHYMLDTSLLDKDKYPLKPKDLIFYSLDAERAPVDFAWTNNPMCQLPLVPGQIAKQLYYLPSYVSPDFLPYEQRVMAVDPAGGGQNGDENGYCVLFTLAGRIFLMEIGGVQGGASDTQLDALLDIAKKWKVQKIICEKNFGHGMFTAAMQKRHMERKAEGIEFECGIVEVYSTGQKEARIIDVLEPVISGHNLIVNSACIQDNIDNIQKYSADVRVCFSLFHQMANLSRDRGSLVKDDRIDSLAIGVQELMLTIQQTASEAIKKKKINEHNERLKDKNNIWSHAYGGINNLLVQPKVGIMQRLSKRRR